MCAAVAITTPILAAPALAGAAPRPDAAAAHDRAGDALLEQATAAALREASVRVVQVVPGLDFVASVVVTRDNRASQRIRHGDGRARVIRIGPNAYSKANAAYYTERIGVPPALARRIAGKWVRSPADTGFETFLDMGTYLTAALGPSGTARVSGRGRAEGRAVIFLRDEAENGTIAVRAAGEPLPVRIEYEPKGLGVVRFSRWGAKVRITAPKTFISVPSDLTAGVSLPR